MEYQFGFSIYGLIIFLLPMLINILYFAKEKKEEEQPSKCNRMIEAVEQGMRVLYVIAICVLISKKAISFQSPWLYAALVFLILYYIVWIRYFNGGMERVLLSASFLFVPLPLAVFPVLYFIFASLWIHNSIAAVIMVVFGVAHITVSYQNLC